ncbi:hypothetical protein FJN14_02405 [Alteromonas mediterranea]|nr:hypothetical protein FJN14_02405 [Alteromonas mediterranea]
MGRIAHPYGMLNVAPCLRGTKKTTDFSVSALKVETLINIYRKAIKRAVLTAIKHLNVSLIHKL